jgi:phage tail sheath protein FI
MEMNRAACLLHFEHVGAHNGFPISSPRTLTLTEQIVGQSSAAPLVVAPGAGRDAGRVELPAHFRFACFDANFEAAVEDGDEGPVLTMRGAICNLPYSAEDPAARRRLQSLLRATAKTLPRRVVLSSRQRIEFRGEVLLEMPVAPAQVLQQASIMLLRWRPLFNLVRGLN